MIPASQASLRAWSAVIGSPVSNTGRLLAVAEQVLQRHGDHDRGVHAAGLGEPVDGVAGDVLAERVPEPLRGAGVLPVLRGELIASTACLSIAPTVAGQREPAVAQPVPVVGDGEPAGLLGEGFLALQGLELVVFGDLGGDHLEDLVREPAQRDRVVLVGAGRSGGPRRRGGARPATRRHPSRSPPPAPRTPARRPSRPGPARGRGPGRARAPGDVWRPAWSAGWCWPTRLPVSVAPAFAPRSSRSAWRAWRSSSSVIWCRSWRQGGQVGLGLGGPAGSTARGRRRSCELLGDGGDRGRDRVLSGVVECRCHTGNSGTDHRQSWSWNRVHSGQCGEVFRKFLEPSVWWSRTALAAPPQPPLLHPERHHAPTSAAPPQATGRSGAGAHRAHDRDSGAVARRDFTPEGILHRRP